MEVTWVSFPVRLKRRGIQYCVRGEWLPWEGVSAVLDMIDVEHDRTEPQ